MQIVVVVLSSSLYDKSSDGVLRNDIKLLSLRGTFSIEKGAVNWALINSPNEKKTIYWKTILLSSINQLSIRYK